MKLKKDLNLKILLLFDDANIYTQLFTQLNLVEEQGQKYGAPIMNRLLMLVSLHYTMWYAHRQQYIYIYIYIHTYTHIYAETHTHSQTQTHMLSVSLTLSITFFDIFIYTHAYIHLFYILILKSPYWGKTPFTVAN